MSAETNNTNQAASESTVMADSLPAMTLREHNSRRKSMLRSESFRGLLFITPWLFGVLAFVAYPFFFSLYISFHKLSAAADGSGLSFEFVGWLNFKYAFIIDNEFPVQMLQFIQQTILTVPITVIFALLVSVLLNQKFPGRMLFRAIFFLPVIFATGQVLSELFREGQGSIPFIDQYNLEDTIYAMFPRSLADSLMGVLKQFVIVLWYSGIQVLIFLAAFQTISPSTYEAARIDGVTPWESFWKITFPAIIPFIVLNLIYTIVDLATFPFNPILTHISNAMGDAKTGYGYASALGWIYFLIIFIPIGLLVLLARRQNNGKR
ncbi:carbohydrate ABC transporter permease [Paenibacillus eucommiae]|uniref:ABC-type sugar transport system permease subunit n=1 Tax=Paenibacillus eucommiae TaxID=1355755 RepID=A0ABS4IM69_9BACL|nr:sugar ABC transporter permease [Paenibacillus eucommiae]MBP1988603.1 ABC-type sugar transport system permease subunit [Paenibacillus eucommiae]